MTPYQTKARKLAGTSYDEVRREAGTYLQRYSKTYQAATIHSFSVFQRPESIFRLLLAAFITKKSTRSDASVKVYPSHPRPYPLLPEPAQHRNKSSQTTGNTLSFCRSHARRRIVLCVDQTDQKCRKIVPHVLFSSCLGTKKPSAEALAKEGRVRCVIAVAIFAPGAFLLPASAHAADLAC